MKTTDEIEKMGRNYANSGDGDKFPALDFLSPMDWDEIELSIVDAYSAAYRQAQQDMMEGVANAPLIAKDFQEWLKGAFEKHRQDWSRHGSSLKHFENMLNHAFTAGRLSGLKECEERVKELERELYRMNQFRKTGAPCDDSDFPNAKQLEQGE